MYNSPYLDQPPREHEQLHPTQKVRLARLLNQACYNTDTGELEGYEDALNKMIEENSGGC